MITGTARLGFACAKSRQNRVVAGTSLRSSSVHTNVEYANHHKKHNSSSRPVRLRIQAADVGGRKIKQDPGESRKARTGAWPSLPSLFSGDSATKKAEEKAEEKDTKTTSSLDALYFNGTVRAGQLVEHDGTVVVRFPTAACTALQIVLLAGNSLS